MEEKLKSYHNNVSYLIDNKKIAAAMRDLLNDDLNKLKSEYSSFVNLDTALQNYFIRREYRYAIQLLENYLAKGDIQLENRCEKNIHYPEKYKQIEEVITKLFSEEAYCRDYRVSQ